MNALRFNLTALQDPDALLERTFFDEFLRSQGYDPRRMHELPKVLVRELMTQASLYASGKLTEIAARAGFVEGLHGVIMPE